MLARIVFCSAVVLAILAVIVLALVAHVPHRKAAEDASPSWLALSLYIQQPTVANPPANHSPPSNSGALIFQRTLTEGPENTSRVVGEAQGFIIPVEEFADSAFNIIYMTFDTQELSGSISIQTKGLEGRVVEQLTVVGGTGSFAFARGLAFFAQTDNLDAPYHIKLKLEFPDRSQTIPG